MSENTIEIKKRPWYVWLLTAGWIVLLVAIAQNAIASGQELEPRAATIFWVSFVVVLLAGGAIWFVRRNQ
jgi:hypothetical protein